MVYKNISNVPRKYYGVVFEPGSVHIVPGHISDSKFIRMPDDYIHNCGCDSAVAKSTTKTKKEESDHGSNNN